MADSTEEVVPAGWEKRLSRSTGKSSKRVYVFQKLKKMKHNRFYPNRYALLFERLHKGVTVGLSNISSRECFFRK